MKTLRKSWDIYYFITLIILLALFITIELKEYLQFKIKFSFSTTNNSHSLSKKYNIGIIVPYNFLGDAEIAQHMRIASQNLGWNSYTFQYAPLAGTSPFFSKYVSTILNIANHFFKPDFVIHLLPSYFTISPTDIPNYVRVPFELTEIFKYSNNFSRQTDISWANIGSYDGYMHIDNKRNWDGKIDIKSIITNNSTSTSSIHITTMYPTVFSTPFTSLKYNKIFYCGANWDKLRSSDHYKEILTKLAQHNIIKTFGPEKTWDFIKDAYQGYIPHDGFSLINKIQELGITLILHSKYHLETGIPTNRIFEAAAASSLIISDHHPLVKKEFGDCVLYIDPSQPAETVANKIISYVKWANKNPRAASIKAKCAHDIFIQKFTMENELLKIAQMHEIVIKEKNSL